MTKPSHPRGPRAGLFACAALAVSVLVPAFVPALVQTARAVPFHTPVINGTITQNAATDWDPADLVVNDVADDNTATRTANLRRLWCTWDETNLYLAVSYQDWGATEALAVYLDLGLGEGPDDASLLDFGAGPLLMPGGGHIDLVLARNPDDSALNVPGPAPEVRLVAADGTTTDITAQVTRAQGFNTGAAQEKASLPFWFNAEFALPWSVLYPDGLPSHAVIKAAAVVNKADTTPPDLAPNNTTVDAATGSIVLEHLHASVIDQDGDGQPDPASGSVAFTVTLPEDNGTAVVTAAAYLDDFAGGDLGAPVATVTGAAGARTLTLPRLTAGRYTITASAEGWVDGSFGVDVAAGEAVTGQALTLDKATAVRGTVGFTRGTGAPGSVAILDQDGATIMTRTFTVAAPDFVMWVQRSGRYTVRASATDHFPAEATLDVTAHVDVDGVSILLEPLPLLSGEVTFASGPGHQGTIALLDEAGEPVRDAANRPVAYGFLASGGPFALHAPYAGHFTLRVVAGPCYVITDR
ncbi:MAG TPA: hypothetical protein PLQ13_13015, partial [Candidatus Krumholzibacteria bacterium]|nr:hypothetical protein [Candidatus Krumholzibacteria bacterium]